MDFILWIIWIILTNQTIYIFWILNSSSIQVLHRLKFNIHKIHKNETNIQAPIISSSASVCFSVVLLFILTCLP